MKSSVFWIVAASLLVVLLCPFVGITELSWSIVFSQSEAVDHVIFWDVRAPRALLAFFVGGSLALAGTVFQAVFRNFLASPFTLGVSSGAAFGASLHLLFGFSLFWVSGLGATSLAALLGALATLLLIYFLSRASGGSLGASILLSGLAVNFFFASLVVFFQYLSDPSGVLRMTRWLMGGLEGATFDKVWLIIPFSLFGWALVGTLGSSFDVLAAGEELAMSRGVDVKKVLILSFLSASILVGGVVSLCGPIGFVDIMVPHMCRKLVGHGHRSLLVVSFFFGGAFLALCDTLARIVIAPFEIPAGIITALLGGPFFVWLLLKSSNDAEAR